MACFPHLTTGLAGENWNSILPSAPKPIQKASDSALMETWLLAFSIPLPLAIRASECAKPSFRQGPAITGPPPVVWLYSEVTEWQRLFSTQFQPYVPNCAAVSLLTGARAHANIASNTASNVPTWDQEDIDAPRN
jgi:hypothetical protein